MKYSREALLWVAILFGLETVVASPAGQTRVFLNSTLVSKVTDIYTPGPLTSGTNSLSTIYFITHTRSRSGQWGQGDEITTTLPSASSSTGTPTLWANTTVSYPTNSNPPKSDPTKSDRTKPGPVPTDFTKSDPPEAEFTPDPEAPPGISFEPLPEQTISIIDDGAVATDKSDCITLAPDEPVTSWSIVPNTTVVTVTITGDDPPLLTPTPEFTPPVYCSDTIPLFGTGPASSTIGKPTATPKDSTDSAIVSSSTSIFGWAPMPTFSAPLSTRLTVTVITTSKNAVTITTQATLPTFPGGGNTAKQSVDPSTYTDTHVWGPIPDPGLQTNPPLVITTIVNENLQATTRITEVVDGITLVVSPSQVLIGGQLVNIGNPPKTITEGGDVFTVSPGQVEGPLLIIKVPTFTGDGGNAQPTPQPPKPTTVQGVPVQVGPTGVVIGGSTIPIRPGATPTTVVVGRQTISVGPGGVGFSGTTITPPPSMPTNVVIIGGEGFSAIGGSVAIIGTTTISYGPGSIPQTVIHNGELITVGPQGVVFDGTTIGGPAQPTGTQYGLAGGLSVTEIGSTLAVINGVTLTIGPQAQPISTRINGQTVSAGPNGLVINGNALGFPFNPTVQAVTMAGVAFSQIGASLAVIGGTTYTFGPGATPLTTVVDGKTLIAGPSGLVIGDSTLTYSAPTQAVTAGGITFSQIGSTLAVIGGKTYTFGPGATQTTTVINGLTISIGPGGIGFKTTTYTASTSTPTGTSGAKATGKGKKNGAARLGPVDGVLGICMIAWIGCFIGFR